ncbi:hypothetical protein BDP27DRAFT_1361280 [Rhodocollybia butyracea]|uniref:Uncharacterized protein n=1 Tax=Rhodocollybia butyracea TaxID=206335 RepID=A0A9P5PZG4_9AGAR|nr:hypothetical protein BDP27DRAFT_1361280 [Rhodocollybia butyracea]
MSVATLIKVFKDGTASVGSYDTILEVAMKNAKSRNALMKAIMDNTKLFQPMVTDFPNAVEITVGIKKHLTPPHGTRGFHKTVTVTVKKSKKPLTVTGIIRITTQTVSAFKQRTTSTTKKQSDNLLVIVGFWVILRAVWYPYTAVHIRSVYGIREYRNRNRKLALQALYSTVTGTRKTVTVNRIIRLRAMYKETFTAQIIQPDPDPANFGFVQLNGLIYGMSVITVSSEVGTPINMAGLQRGYNLWYRLGRM